MKLRPARRSSSRAGRSTKVSAGNPSLSILSEASVSSKPRKAECASQSPGPPALNRHSKKSISRMGGRPGPKRPRVVNKRSIRSGALQRGILDQITAERDIVQYMRRQCLRRFLTPQQSELSGSSHSLANHRLVLFRLKRTGGINQSPARLELRQARTQQRHLPHMKLPQIFRPQSPSNFRVAPQSPSPRARCIYQDACKLLPKGKRASSIQL